MSPKRFSRTPAFTLIEILAVVAIIALLVAILVPSLIRSQRAAKTTICGAHLHQLGVAAEMYLSEHGSYPGHKWRLRDGTTGRWPIAVSGYLLSEDLLICPSVPEWIVGRNNSFGYNYKYLGSLRLNNASPTAPYERFPVKSVRSPVSTIAYADSDGTGWTRPYTPDPTVTEPDRIGHHGYTIDPTYIPQESLQTVNNEGENDAFAFHEYRSYISDRHRRASNAVWADGHVTRITPRDVYQNNRFWNGLGAEDANRDPHVSFRVWSGHTFRYADQIN